MLLLPLNWHRAKFSLCLGFLWRWARVAGTDLLKNPGCIAGGCRGVGEREYEFGTHLLEYGVLLGPFESSQGGGGWGW